MAKKMSKARGNVVNPDDMIDEFRGGPASGFMNFWARWKNGQPWNTKGVEGVYRFLVESAVCNVDEKSETRIRAKLDR